MPWMVPRLTLRSMSRLAHTGPKRLLMALSSMAKSETAPPEGRCSICDDESDELTCERSRALAVGHVVVHLDRAVGDALGGSVNRSRGVSGNHGLVVVVHGKAHALLGDAERDHTGLEAGITRLEGVVDGVVDALQHRGQYRARCDVVLVAVNADRHLAAVLGRLDDAEARSAGSGVNDIRALVEVGLGELAGSGRVIPG